MLVLVYLEMEISGNCLVEVLKRIEGNDYIENKEKHNEYLKLHPFVAKKKFINIINN